MFFLELLALFTAGRITLDQYQANLNLSNIVSGLRSHSNSAPYRMRSIQVRKLVLYGID